MFVVTYRKFFYILSTLLIIASIAAVSVWGFNLGIDFKGGTITEIDFPQGRPDQIALTGILTPLNLETSVRPTSDNGYIIKMKEVNQTEKASFLSSLDKFGTTTIKRFDSIGPVLGAEALRKALFSIILVIIAIVLFISYAFRKVSEPVSSWKYGIVAIIALAHDVIIPTGVFVALGHFAGYEIDTLFIIAILVVLGFSVHDTIVVFDRVRENLHDASAKKPFDQIVGESISQTFTRSINTSLTTLLALIVLYFLGGESTQHFSLALIVGIFAGTYSSVFIGSPLLVTIWKWKERKEKR